MKFVQIFLLSVLSYQTIFAGHNSESSESCSEEHSVAVQSSSISTAQWIILLSLLNSISRAPQIPQANLAGVCNGKPFGYYAYPPNCRGYYICSTNGFNRFNECPEGNYFEASSGLCKAGTCPAAPSPLSFCDGKPAGKYRDPADLCRSYFYCRENSRFLIQCPVGQYYNSITEICEVGIC